MEKNTETTILGFCRWRPVKLRDGQAASHKEDVALELLTMVLL